MKKIIPNHINFTHDKIYSPKTQFTSEFRAKRQFGGGQSFQGTFP